MKQTKTKPTEEGSGVVVLVAKVRIWPELLKAVAETESDVTGPVKEMIPL